MFMVILGQQLFFPALFSPKKINLGIVGIKNPESSLLGLVINSQSSSMQTQQPQSVADNGLPNTSTHPLGPQEKVGIPARIEISSIALNSVIEKVALADGRSIDVPKLPMNTGWYDLGPRPGQKGTAIIDGHVNWLDGSSGVFANLHSIQPGDAIKVIDDKGATVSFIVRESKSYNASSHPKNVFSSNDGKSHLNIITCDGVWDSHAKQYSKRLVVFADKE